MSIIHKVDHFFKHNLIINYLKKVRLKKFNGISLYEFLIVFRLGIAKGNFPLRAAAVSWILFFSMFPFALFLFSVLPYAPLYLEIKEALFTQLLPLILPERIGKDVIEYISLTVGSREDKGQIHWIFILVSTYMSSNGIHGIINGFNNSYLDVYTKRKMVRQRIVAIMLTLFFVGFLITQLFLIYYGSFMFRYVEEAETFVAYSPLSLLVNYASAALFHFISMLMLFYYGPNTKKGNRTVIPGAILASILFIFTVIGFNIYLKAVNNFSLLYGSLGLVMIMMIFTYLNVIIILIGFEWNMALSYAKNYKEEEKLIL